MRAPYRVDRDHRRVERARRGAGACPMPDRSVVLGLVGAQPRAAGRDRGRLPRRRRPRRERRDRCRRQRRAGGLARGIRPRSSGRAADRQCRHLGRPRPGQPRRAGRDDIAADRGQPPRRRQHDRAAGAGDVRARRAAGSSRSPRSRVSRPALQPRLLRQQGRGARLCRGAAAASGAARGRGHRRVPRVFLVADDRPLGRADARFSPAASGPRAASSAASTAARARIDFPWPLVLGMRFCDLAPAAIGDAILRGFRFRIRAA